MALRPQISVVGVKAESSDYTLNTPLAADSWPAFNVSFSVGEERFQREESREIFARLDEITGPQTCEMSFSVLLVGSGTAGTAPHFTDAFRAAGMSLTNVPATSDTYKPVSTFNATGDNPSLSYSFGWWVDGIRFLGKGGVCNCKIIGETGKPMMAEFTFFGAYQAVADAAVLTPSGVSTQTPPRFLSASVETVGGASQPFTRVEWDLNNDIQPVPDANDSNGVKGYRIVGRRPQGTVNPEIPLVATDDIFGDWTSGTTGAISTGTIGSSGGNQIGVTAGRCQYRGPSIEDDGGILRGSCEFAITTAEGASDGDDMSIVFT